MSSDMNMSLTNGSSLFNESSESCETPISWASVMISANLLSTIVGATGNCLVCIAVWKTVMLHSTINYYMVSLAIADLIVTLIVQPLMVAVISGRLKGDLECTNTLDKVYRAIGNFSCAASFFNLCFISFERIFAVLRPFNTLQNDKSKRFVCFICISWFVPVVYSVLRVTSSRKGTSYFSGIIFGVGFIWIASCYAIILIFLRLQAKKQENLTTAEKRQRNNEKTITVTMVLVVTCFTIMWLPFFYFRLSGNSSLNSGLVYELAITLALCNSSFNPIIYSFRNKKYRQAFKRILKFGRQGVLARDGTRETTVSRPRPRLSTKVWQMSSRRRKTSSATPSTECSTSTSQNVTEAERSTRL